jgi:hypothetical protein
MIRQAHHEEVGSVRGIGNSRCQMLILTLSLSKGELIDGRDSIG